MDELPAEAHLNPLKADMRISFWTSGSDGLVNRQLDPTTPTATAIDAGISSGDSFTVSIELGERWMIIAGHEDWLTCTVAPEGSEGDTFFDLEGSTASGERTILLGGQWIAWPRRLLVSRDLVDRAARAFGATGDLDQNLTWKRQVRGKQPGE